MYEKTPRRNEEDKKEEKGNQQGEIIMKAKNIKKKEKKYNVEETRKITRSDTAVTSASSSDIRREEFPT